MKIKREIEKCRVENESKKIGISLMMLVIMIVVIIILATVVILSVTKNNAIGSASDAVKEQDRASIQDKVAMVLASIQTKYRCSVKIEPGQINEGIEYELVNSKDKKIEGGIIGWNEEMADETGKDNSYTLEIEMPTYGNEKTEWYIDSKGEVALKIGDIIYGNKTEEMEKDETPGDITDGGKQDGSEEKPYKIRSIEDLVAFSKEVNEKRMKNKYIELEKSLDFEKESSYVDSKSKEYGDINNDGKIEELKEELLSGEGFTPIGNNKSHKFSGFFLGKGFEINNIYQNSKTIAGLFGYVGNATISDLSISGKLISNKGSAGGIIAVNNDYTATVNILNCSNKCDIIANLVTQYNGVGGIVGGGDSTSSNLNIINCYNEGTITLNKVESSYHPAVGAGGIIGSYRSIKVLNIHNSYNAGEIISTVDGAGILGGTWAEGKINIVNCCNYGKISAGTVYNISNTSANTSTSINNCYYLENNYNGKDSSFATSYVNDEITDTINKLNNYVLTDIINDISWKKWIKGKNGPVFEVNS